MHVGRLGFEIELVGSECKISLLLLMKFGTDLCLNQGQGRIFYGLKTVYRGLGACRPSRL